MATIEERMVTVEVRTTALEGHMVETNRTLMAADADLKTMIAALDARMERTITALDVRMERRFDALDRRFMSLLALQFTTLLAIIAAAVGVITRQL
jgi:hypothetical protein